MLHYRKHMKKKHYIFLSLILVLFFGYAFVQQFPWRTQVANVSTEEVLTADLLVEENGLEKKPTENASSTQDTALRPSQGAVKQNTGTPSSGVKNTTTPTSSASSNLLATNTKPIVEKKQSLISITDQGVIVQAHNVARAAVSVSPLVWSSSLAQGAEEWAHELAKDSCSIRHAPFSLRKGAGENIWYGAGYDVWNVSQMVNDWVSEKKDYFHATNECASGAVCGHYTQVVWGNTTAVGCGMVACSNERVLVCRYSPAGNIIGQKPY